MQPNQKCNLTLVRSDLPTQGGSVESGLDLTLSLRKYEDKNVCNHFLWSSIHKTEFLPHFMQITPQQKK